MESNFQAIQNANTGSGIKDINGIVVHACTRHSCYCPSSCVNFPLGEQQKVVDYSILETFKTTNMIGIERRIEIYDIICQYFKQIAKRFLQGKDHISLPTIEFEKAIGMFHVHGHKDSCFFRYATNFVKGANMVDGWNSGDAMEHFELYFSKHANHISSPPIRSSWWSYEWQQLKENCLNQWVSIVFMGFVFSQQ